MDEPVGIGDGTDNAFWFCPDGTTKSGPGDAALDWNYNGNRRDMGVDSDVNGSGEKETLKGFWDWANLKFDFQNTAAYVTDNCGVPVCRLTVVSNEPVEGSGSGNTSPDWEVLDDHRVRLRAERSGTGSGRIYTISIACTDEGGAIATASAAVTVPR